MSIRRIDHPLPGERVVALSPENANAAATDWLRRPNLFPGRALTESTLDQRQRWQAGRIAIRGQAFTAGVVNGLEVHHSTETDGTGTTRVRIHVMPGRALTASGEDVVLPTEVAFNLTDLPVVAEPVIFADAAGEAPPSEPGSGGLGVLRPRTIGTMRLGELIAVRSDILPPAGVLVLQPVIADRFDFDPNDPCDRCRCADDTRITLESFEDWHTADGVRLLWYAWPNEWRTLPAPGTRQRNALAHIVFDAEAQLPPAETLPWGPWGAPIALFVMNDAWQPVFVDRAAVVRQGGRARDARLTLAAPTRLNADSRLPGLWQARIEQLAEHIAELGNPPPNAATLAQSFGRLPPAGLLPTHVLDMRTLPLNLATESLRSDFFPAHFELDAAPVPIEQLDVAVRAAAPLAPLDFSVAERVRVLVPVTQSSYESRLLYEEVVAAEFQQTLDRFLATRARALGARQGMRNALAALATAITGKAETVPAFDDDPQALEPETLTPWGPPPPGGGHRAQLAAGRHQHFFHGATATFTLQAAETLFAWVYLDPEHPPRTLMLQWHVGGNWEHRAYWGDDTIEWGVNGTVSRQQIDAQLPPLGRWVRLSVDPTRVGISTATPIAGMAFTLFDGQAAFGPTGGASAATDRVWFANTLPAGAQMGGDYPWSFLTENDLWMPFEAALGLAVPSGTDAPTAVRPTGVVTAVSTLRADPVLTPLSVHERAQLDARGVQGFINYLKARADRADDLVDYSFIKVQTDVYRVRQLVLGITAATRLAVSPVLAGIAKAETAVASQEQISTFFQTLTQSAGTSRPSASRALGGGGGAAPPAAFEVAPRGVSPMRNLRGTPFTATVRPGSGVGTDFSIGSGIAAEPRIGVRQPGVGLTPAPDTDLRPGVRDNAAIVRELIDGPSLIPTRPPAVAPSDITNALPIVGKANIRTTAIAQRMEDPKAIEAKDYTAATRHEAVLALVQFADQLRAEDSGVTPGLFEGIDVYGVRDDPFLGAGNTTRRRPLANFITDRALLPQLLATPLRTRVVPNAAETLPDEGAYFSDSADLADNTVALMRQVEGRIKLYRDAIATAERTLAELQAATQRGSARLASIGDDLAEARHDVSVARALLAEETERIGGINQRRATVLAQEVRFLVFVRPREADNLAAAPRRQIDPGLLEAPAPACLAEHGDAPDELTDMLRVVREAPAAWFVDVPKLFDRLDRADLLVKAIKSAQVRTLALPQFKALTPFATAATTPIADRRIATLANVRLRQQQVVADARANATRIDIARLNDLTWQNARDQATQVVSLGDLVDGEHGRGEVARRAAQTFEDIARMSACLHAELSAVAPSIRLDWAESLSQFDQAPSLRRLGSLARWGEIGYTERYRLQAYVDWLFARVNAAEPRADGLINDVVRMCLLLASHAPIGRIIAGRLPRPVTVRPGVRLPLTAFEVDKLRVGMQALVYRGTNVVARAVVEDIGATEIATRVIHTSEAQLALDVDVRVQFSPAAQISLAAARLPGGIRR